MSPYSQTLATARLDALEALVQALNDAQTPDEKRRCAVAIFNAPEPCELDDTVEYAGDDGVGVDGDGDGDGDGKEHSDNSAAPDPESESAAAPRATISPVASDGQPVPACNLISTSPLAPASPNPISGPFSSVERMNSILQAAGIPPIPHEEAHQFLNTRFPPSSA